MGIPGLFKEIGKGDRIALARLCVTHLEQHNRPIRIAIDAAIWNFQTQYGGVGGKNPALRTLFYRLVKLLALPIHPVFVYDGRNKPLCKRGKTVSRWHGGTIPEKASRKLISLFAFPCHVAPGEAEAECAMLQSRGIVDAVMTQDVDAIMFGSGLTLRDWSREGKTKGNGPPTHVNAIDLKKLKEISRGLDPEAMILVALLSGGDYDEDGVAGIGISLACEIARAGFGTDLLDLVKKGDEDGIKEWRERLQYELETNESGYFKTKRKSVHIPDDFPNRKVLDYYMNPAVTEEADIGNLERKWLKEWDEVIEVQALREYTAVTLDWQYKPGAWHFVRNMAPALLADRLQRGAASSLVTSEEQITERRHHFANGGISELRITVVPADVVGLDLNAEEDSPEHLESLAAAEEEDEDTREGVDEEQDPAVPSSPTKKRKKAPWLPWNTEKMWIAETITALGAQKHVERWNQVQWELENDAKKFATRKCRKKADAQKTLQKTKDTGGMQTGAMCKYIGAVTTTDKPVHLIEKSSNPASKSISDLMASVEELLLPSPARPKANTKAHERQSRGGPPEEPLPSYLNPLTQLAAINPSKEEDPFPTFETHAGGRARSSTSSSADPVPRVSQKSSKVRAKKTTSALATAVPSSSLYDGFGLVPKVLRSPILDGPILGTKPLGEQVARLSSTTKDNIDKVGSAKDVPEPEAMHSNITQRSPKRLAKKDQTRVEVQPSSPSPVRLKRPIQEFFVPYLKPRGPAASSSLDLSSHQETDMVSIPPELSTGLRTTLSMATHLHAIPRSSLPGTWKEAECVSGPSSQAVRSEACRPSRVSFVDLTAD